MTKVIYDFTSDTTELDILKSMDKLARLCSKDKKVRKQAKKEPIVFRYKALFEALKSKKER